MVRYYIDKRTQVSRDFTFSEIDVVLSLVFAGRVKLHHLLGNGKIEDEIYKRTILIF